MLADAAGHGIGPALSVTQMHAMLRMAFRMGGGLRTAFVQVNNLLAEILPDGHFVTAFIGLLDPVAHTLRFISGGQAPILHFVAAQGHFVRYNATSFPMGAMPMTHEPAPVESPFGPGDILVLLSDGIYEYADGAGERFGCSRVERLIEDQRDAGPEQLGARLLEAVQAFAGPARQDDDVTIVLVKRDST